MLHFAARAKGKRLGRPKKVVDVAKIAALRAQGRSWSEISALIGMGGAEQPREPYRARQKTAQNSVPQAPKAQAYSGKFMRGMRAVAQISLPGGVNVPRPGSAVAGHGPAWVFPGLVQALGATRIRSECGK